MSDAIIGECVDQIGDIRAHPPTKRNRWGSHGWRLDGYGYNGDYSEYEAEVLGPLNMKGQGPLWLPFEFREEEGGYQISKNDKWNSPTAYHFHNFFMSDEEFRFKYSTYGHADPKAQNKTLMKLHGDGDTLVAVACAHGIHTKYSEKSFGSIKGSARPIYYMNEEARRARHSVWQDIVREDDAKYGS